MEVARGKGPSSNGVSKEYLTKLRYLDVACAMIGATKIGSKGIHILEADEIQQNAGRNGFAMG